MSFDLLLSINALLLIKNSMKPHRSPLGIGNAGKLRFAKRPSFEYYSYCVYFVDLSESEKNLRSAVGNDKMFLSNIRLVRY